jgi:hypothetical protein
VCSNRLRKAVALIEFGMDLRRQRHHIVQDGLVHRHLLYRFACGNKVAGPQCRSWASSRVGAFVAAWAVESVRLATPGRGQSSD